VPITSEPITSGTTPPVERAVLARDLLATDVDLRDPAAVSAVVDLVAVVHDLLTRS
jgi:hypothetical protein